MAAAREAHARFPPHIDPKCGRYLSIDLRHPLLTGIFADGERSVWGAYGSETCRQAASCSGSSLQFCWWHAGRVSPLQHARILTRETPCIY